MKQDNPQDKPPGNKIETFELDVKGHHVHYLKSGQGKPVVLVHGGASDSRDWLALMNYSGDHAGNRYTFYAPDLPGFGQSARNEKGYFLSDFSDFLTGFIAQLKLDGPALAGHSFGARVCLDIVMKPENNISKLILIDASGLGAISLFGNILFGFFRMLRKLLGKREPYPRILSWQGDNYNYVGKEALQSIKVPTLLVWKSLDPYMPVSNARRAQRLIPGAKLVVFKGYGHAPHQQNNSEPFSKALLEFLDANGGKP